MSDLPQPEHTIPVQAFVKTLKGTADEVFSKLLLIEHRGHNKTVAAWHEALHGHRGIETAPAEAVGTPETPPPQDHDEESV